MAPVAQVAAETLRRRSETGTGLIASLSGLTAFIILLLIAVQVMFDLYARSAITAAAFEAAKQVAGFNIANLPPDQLAIAESAAEAQARQTLGHYGNTATFTWTITAASVALRVQVTNESLVPAGLGRVLGIDAIDRTVRVQPERLICVTSSACPAGQASAA